MVSLSCVVFLLDVVSSGLSVRDEMLLESAVVDSSPSCSLQQHGQNIAPMAFEGVRKLTLRIFVGFSALCPCIVPSGVFPISFRHRVHLHRPFPAICFQSRVCRRSRYFSFCVVVPFPPSACHQIFACYRLPGWASCLCNCRRVSAASGAMRPSSSRNNSNAESAALSSELL